MKIEMGESLFYSWLRHVKECHIVQNNWKVSPQWELHHEADINKLMSRVSEYFFDKYEYKVFKNNSSFAQILQQGECDAIGVAIQDGSTNIYAVDVAFHENGLNYGEKDVTIMKVIAKTVRTAMCLWGYMECKNAEIVFASPKINPAIYDKLIPCMDEVNNIFKELGYGFEARIIANEDFYDDVLHPILLVSEGVADTAELFLRAYQMYNMFAKEKVSGASSRRTTVKSVKRANETEYVDVSEYKELKIGKIARVILRRKLEEGKASPDEIQQMQTVEYSKEIFDIQYPLLVKDGTEFDTVRYYAEPVYINDEKYYMCSQWFEVAANNDRPYLIKWIEEHE